MNKKTDKNRQTKKKKQQQKKNNAKQNKTKTLQIQIKHNTLSGQFQGLHEYY